MTGKAIFIKEQDTVLLKKALAKYLYLKNFDQFKISKILNISQPMVSNYCNSKEKIPDNIIKIAENISKEILNKNSLDFYTCVSFAEKNYEGQYFIAEKNEVINDEKNRIIDNLTEAFLLLKDKDIGKLLPEIKINIAIALEKAENADDVAAFLNGLIVADNKVTSNNGIRFGKSKHLSSLLLYLKNIIDIKAIMNIAFINEIKKTSFNYDYLTKDYRLKNVKKNLDILLHKGDFGIEPCAYVIGKDAVDVANKVIKLMEELK
ncbi:MAG: thiamine-phosphate synthase family protein [Thermoplasmatota archaeon]|jgi:predicted fused transcriptional regulator/phosphomethylpyrimidine kinase/predicted XRE-type DNA-binding protein